MPLEVIAVPERKSKEGCMMGFSLLSRSCQSVFVSGGFKEKSEPGQHSTPHNAGFIFCVLLCILYV